MKTTLDHLPDVKQQELRRATDIIVEMVAPEMIVLFGSYARGDWQEEREDDGVHFRYQSDYDLLVVARNDHQARKIEGSEMLRRRLAQELATPVSLVAEDINHINQHLDKARYFYVDILREGVMLYDAGRVELAEPRELDPAQRRALAQEDYDHWIGKSRSMMRTYEACLLDDNWNDAAFMLHQATERACTALLLVYTNYKPRTHDLGRLGELITSVEPEYLQVFPMASDQDIHRFELLRAAYVEARYLKTYAITRDDLEWLSERVTALQALAERLCPQRIASYV